MPGSSDRADRYSAARPSGVDAGQQVRPGVAEGVGEHRERQPLELGRLAGGDPRRPGQSGRAELGEQGGLAHAGLAQQFHHMEGIGVQGARQLRELRLPPDHTEPHR
ncbi:hypothetical protein GCM10018954_048560 [Kutzneria kofuensis]